MTANIQPAKKQIIENMDERLVRISRTGMNLDPLSITLVHAMALNPRHTDARIQHEQGKVLIETKGRGQFTIPCASYKEACQLAKTLTDLANQRAKDSARLAVKHSIDWGKSKLGGDPAYEEERARIFRNFI